MNKACEIDLPELIKTQHLVANLQSKNNPSANILTANNLTRAMGRGMEYAESRIYQPGDDARHIDWRLTARHAKTYTKLYHEEKGENNYIILDLTASMYFGTEHALKSVIASKIAAILAWHGLNQHNNVGSIIFNNFNTLYTPAKLNKNNILTILSNIISAYDLNLINNADQELSNNLFTSINKFEHLIQKNSKIYIISDFLNIDNKYNYYEKLKKLSSNNLIYLIKLTDPIEHMTLPIGQYNITNNLTSNTLYINKNNQELIKNFFKTKLNNYNDLIHKLKVNNVELLTTPEWSRTLIQKIIKN